MQIYKKRIIESRGFVEEVVDSISLKRASLMLSPGEKITSISTIAGDP
jgi:hypothetical protein